MRGCRVVLITKIDCARGPAFSGVHQQKSCASQRFRCMTRTLCSVPWRSPTPEVNVLEAKSLKEMHKYTHRETHKHTPWMRLRESERGGEITWWQLMKAIKMWVMQKNILLPNTSKDAARIREVLATMRLTSQESIGCLYVFSPPSPLSFND